MAVTLAAVFHVTRAGRSSADGRLTCLSQCNVGEGSTQLRTQAGSWTDRQAGGQTDRQGSGGGTDRG